MNPRLPSLLRAASALVLSFAFSACSDDPELVSKREQQRAEISSLSSELAILQERMEQIPPDRSDEIERLKKEAAENQAEIVALEEEIAALQKEKAEIEKEHESYRRNYVAN